MQVHVYHAHTLGDLWNKTKIQPFYIWTVIVSYLLKTLCGAQMLWKWSVAIRCTLLCKTEVHTWYKMCNSWSCWKLNEVTE